MVAALIIGIGSMLAYQPKNISDPSDPQSIQNVEIRDGVQYVTLTARGGYSPNVSTAQANLPTKLVVKTNGTYDCSASLMIRSIGYQSILQPTGEEVIDVGVPQANTTLQGTCSMGMYTFSVNFI